MAERNIVEAINSALAEEMEADPRVMVLGLDVGKLGGVFRTTSGLVDRFGAERVVDTPLAEAGIVGASLGLALAGMVPVAEIQFLGFTAQGFHQIGPQLAKYRQRSRGRYHCQVTIRAPFGGGIRSPEFHSDGVEAQFVQSPGIKIVMPSNPYDAKGLLIEAIRDPDPVLFCEPDRLYRGRRSEVPDGAYTVPFGKAQLVREGVDRLLRDKHRLGVHADQDQPFSKEASFEQPCRVRHLGLQRQRAGLHVYRRAHSLYHARKDLFGKRLNLHVDRLLDLDLRCEPLGHRPLEFERIGDHQMQ